jgi:hypothetical protein
VLLTASGIAQPPLTYNRAFGSGAYEQIAVVADPGAVDKFLDAGEGLPGPLPIDQGAYNYQVVDGSGASASVGGILPYTSLQVEPDYITALFLRCLQAGVAGVALPNGYRRPTVLHEMPRVGFPTLPFILPNLTNLEQSQTQTGQDFPVAQALPTTGTVGDAQQLQTISVMARRTWRVTVYTMSAGEREFWRDGVLGILQSLLGSVFQPLGLDMSHSFMAHSDQKTERLNDPGFYFCDILWRIEGMYNVGLAPFYGPITTIDSTTTTPASPPPSGIIEHITIT